MSHMPFLTVESKVVEIKLVPIFVASSASGTALDVAVEDIDKRMILSNTEAA